MQIRVTDQAAFILRRRDWQNTSLILDLLTRDHGRISLLAKGARRSPSRAQFQPFVALSLSWSGRQELKTLTAIDGRTLAVDEQNYLPLLYINDLISAFLPQQEANPEVFDAYYDLLERAGQTLDETELRRFELGLMQFLGYFPDIALDADSGEPILPGTSYQFVINSGFVACSAAAHDSVDGQVVRDWIDQNYQIESVRRLAKSVLRSTIDFNLQGKTLKSRDVYVEILRRR